MVWIKQTSKKKFSVCRTPFRASLLFNFYHKRVTNNNPDGKSNSDQQTYRLTIRLIHHGGLIEDPLKRPMHHSTTPLRCLSRTVNLSPIMPRDASVPDSQCMFLQSGWQHYRHFPPQLHAKTPRKSWHRNYVPTSGIIYLRRLLAAKILACKESISAFANALFTVQKQIKNPHDKTWKIIYFMERKYVSRNC